MLVDTSLASVMRCFRVTFISLILHFTSPAFHTHLLQGEESDTGYVLMPCALLKMAQLKWIVACFKRKYYINPIWAMFCCICELPFNFKDPIMPLQELVSNGEFAGLASIRCSGEMSFSSFYPHRETEMREHMWMVPSLNKMLRCVAIFFLAVPVHVMCGESLLFLDLLFFQGRTVIPKLCDTAAAQVETWALFSVFPLREASSLTLSVHNVFKCLYEAGEKKWGTDEVQFMTILCTRNRFHLLRGRSFCRVLDFFPCLRTILP